MIPTLVLEQRGNQVAYKWTNVVPGFALTLPVGVTRGQVDHLVEIKPTTEWQLLEGTAATLSVDPDYYVKVERPKAP